MARGKRIAKDEDLKILEKAKEKISELVTGNPAIKGNSVDDKNWEKLRDVVDSIFKSTAAEREKMRRYLDLYNGKIWADSELDKYDSKAYINYFFSTVQQIAPMLTDNRPRWSIIAHDPYLQNLAAAYSEALKYFWETRDMSMNLLKGAMDSLIMQLGMFKIGFDPNDGFGGNITVSVVDPPTFFIAPGYDDPWKAPFCGTRVRKPISWIKRMFPGIKKVDCDSMVDTQPGVKSIAFGDVYDYELENYFATVTEIWIKDDLAYDEVIDEKGNRQQKAKFPYGKFVYFTPTQYLGTERCDYQHGLPPYVPLYDYAPVHNFIGTGELNHIEGLGLEANLIFQKMCNHARRYANPNVLIDSACMVDVQTIKETYHKGGNLYTYDSNVLAGRSSEIIKPVQEPEMNQINHQLMAGFPRLIEEITGNTEIAKGVMTSKQERSASEVSILIESSYTRTRQRVRNLEWTIKRICYLWVRMMQQYFTEPRNYWTKTEEGIEYDTISNSRATAEEIVRDPLVQQKLAAIQEFEQNPVEGKKKPKLSPEQMEQQEDYERLITAFEKDTDPVYFDFDVVIETNSTLPMDKQSLANMATRLFERKAIDAEALLETIQYPHGKEIAARMKEQEEQKPVNKPVISAPGAQPGVPQ